MIKEDNDITNILRFCGQVLFEVPSNDGNDKNYVDYEQFSKEFEAYFNVLGEECEGKMTHEEKVSMVALNEKYTKGSVDVARGKRVRLLTNDNEKAMRRRTIVIEAKRRHSRFLARSATM
mmetsp:Transcript_23990/g.41080  ORF Transcript_23990/g.41080 Transcript_23990/m.41080 type:complete len:120 (+) Transcript_23990:1-360(+)